MINRYSVTIKKGSATHELFCAVSKATENYIYLTFTSSPPASLDRTLLVILKAKRIPAGRTVEKAIQDFVKKNLSRVTVTVTPMRKRSVKKGAVRLQPRFKLKGSAGRFIPPPAASIEYLGPALGNYKDTITEKNIIETEDPKTKEKSIEFEVIYATTRNRTGSKKPNDFYGKERGNLNDYGTCRVSIPEKRHAGELNRPSWLGNLILGENKKKHFVILNVNPLTQANFLATLRGKFDAYGKRDALIFIHGFNNTFAESIRRAAQIGYDLNFQGPVIAFSWPSMGTVGGYMADIDSAADAGRLLKSLLVDISQTAECENIHIIAHSMGNVSLTRALLNLREDQRYPLPKINQIILAAPDLDQTEFINTIHPKIIHSSAPPRITLYASSEDRALIVSRKIRANYPRVGYAGEHLLVLDGIESIDASLVDTDDILEHSYFAGATSLIYDIRDVLKGLNPTDRVLDSKFKIVNGVKKLYWSIRKAKK